MHPSINLIVIDEADGELPNKGRGNDLCRELLKRGRHRGVSLVLASQSPMFITRDIWRLADRIVIFKITDENDQKRLAQLEGLRGDHTIFERIERGRPIIWDADHGVQGL